jgi:hypothetical protein
MQQIIHKIRGDGKMKQPIFNPFTIFEETYKMSKENYEKMEKSMTEMNQKMNDYLKSEEVSNTLKKMQPVNIWKEYTQTINKSIEDASKKEEFSKTMGDSLKLFLKQQEVVSKMTENYLKQYNIPSKKDIANISSLVVQLEEKVDELNEMFEEQKAAQQRIESKLDQLLSLGNDNKTTPNKK